MSEQPKHQRSWYEEPSFTESAKEIEPNARRFDELCAACKDIIENDAEACPVVADGQFRLARSQQMIPGDPVIGILFTIGSDDVCHLWWVMQAPDPFLSDEAFD